MFSLINILYLAAAVLFLCTEGASFITGHPLVVDGGWVAQ